MIRESRRRRVELPPDKITKEHVFIKTLDNDWSVYRSEAGRIFYYCTAGKRSSWKPPRKFKPSVREKADSSVDTEIGPDTISMVRDSIREGPTVPVPPGYCEYYDKSTGCIFYENCMTSTRWDTALDKSGHLYYFTVDKETGGHRSEWTLPPVHSSLVTVRGHGRSRSEVRKVIKHPSVHLCYLQVRERILFD